MGKIAILVAKRLMIRYLAMVFIYLEGNWNSYIPPDIAILYG
jgi:hypothetical protein